MEPEHTITPEYFPFVYWSTLKLGAVLFVPTFIISVLLFDSGLWIVAFIIYLLLIGLYTFSRHVRHSKTRTEFYETQIIHKTGGIFTNLNTTLNIKNITHLTHKKPWLEHKLYQTGHIYIESAGSGATEAHIQSIEHGTKVYEYTQRKLQENGFSLQKKKLLQEESPSKTAIILQAIFLIGVLFIILEPGSIISLIAIIYNPVLILLVIPALAIVVAGAYVFVKDQLMRTYRVYDDCIDYEEGFLTTRDSIIPAENLAESHNNQNFIDRIISTSNITLNTQGSGSIVFRHMPHGEKLEEIIDSLAKSYQPLTRTGVKENKKSTSSTAQKTVKPQKVRANTFSSSQQQHVIRAISGGAAGLLLIAILSVIVILVGLRYSIAFAALPYTGFFFLAAAGGVVVSFIQAKNTEYEIRKNGVWEKYSFIRRTTNEFTDDKLVGLVITQNPLDQLFKTATIQFQSLTDSANITFKHIRNHQELVAQLRTKYYLESEHEKTIPAKFAMRYDFAKNALFIGPLLILLLTITYLGIISELILAGILALIIISEVPKYFTYKNSHLALHQEHLHYVKGFFFTTEELVRYEDVKTQKSTEYRLTPVGEIYFDIGGKNMVASGEQQNSGFMPNGFSAKYLANPREILDTVDEKMHGLGDTIIHSRRDYANHVITHTLFPPLLLILPFTLWRASKWRYEIQENRIFEYWGVWNRRTQTVLYRNIDHVQEHEGFTNKICKNGSVAIMTLGSGIEIKNSSDYKQIATEIDARYD